MANTYTLISSVTVGSGGASSIDFTSIGSTYTDLLVKLSARSNTSSASSGQWAFVNFNSATTNISGKVLYGVGSTAGSLSMSSPTSYAMYINPSDYTASIFSNSELYVPNYAGSSTKSFSVDSVNENNAISVGENFTAGLWNVTSAITAINITCAAGSFVQYSTAYLYGIKNS